MGFSNYEFDVKTRVEGKLAHDMRLVFPNWRSCKFRGNDCPLDLQKRREDGLLMGYCSNNDSIEDCLVYQILEWHERSLLVYQILE